jgi:three-Cys-motif partner protein
METDPSDSLPISEAGEWAAEKHERLRKYVDITRATRRKYLDLDRPVSLRRGSAYIDLFCGPGRCKIRDSGQIVDGSPLVATKSALAGNVPFSEIHLADAVTEFSLAAQTRVHRVGGNAIGYAESAELAARNIVGRLNPYGLHFAFVDPFNLEGLTFETIRCLSELRHVDLLLHLSVSDLQRNLDRYSAAEHSPLDAVAPGWRDSVDLKQSRNAVRAAYVTYWSSRMHDLGFSHRGVELVTGNQKQRLYWLVFLSRNEFAKDLWDKIRHITGQGNFGF